MDTPGHHVRAHAAMAPATRRDIGPGAPFKVTGVSARSAAPMGACTPPPVSGHGHEAGVRAMRSMICHADAQVRDNLFSCTGLPLISAEFLTGFRHEMIAVARVLISHGSLFVSHFISSLPLAQGFHASPLSAPTRARFTQMMYWRPTAEEL